MSTFNEREYPAKRKPNYSLTELEYYLEVLTQNRKSAILKDGKQYINDWRSNEKVRVC